MLFSSWAACTSSEKQTEIHVPHSFCKGLLEFIRTSPRYIDAPKLLHSLCRVWWGLMVCDDQMLSDNRFQSVWSVEFAFVCYMETVRPCNDVDWTTQCIKLRLARASRSRALDTNPKKLFGLTPVQALNGVCSIVPADIEPSYEDSEYDWGTFKTQNPWCDCYSCVKQFYPPAENSNFGCISKP